MRQEPWLLPASAPALHQALCSVPSLARGPLRLPAALPGVEAGVLVLRVGLCVSLSHLSSRYAESPGIALGVCRNVLCSSWREVNGASYRKPSLIAVPEQGAFRSAPSCCITDRRDPLGSWKSLTLDWAGAWPCLSSCS